MTVPGSWTSERAQRSPLAPAAPVPAPLDVLDRLLLHGDGTVSLLLELCASEPIEVVVTAEVGPAPAAALIGAARQPCRREQVLAAIPASERALLRRVVLRGARTRLAYVAAESFLVPDRLPPAVVREIRAPGGSIGRALAQHAIEHRRTLVAIAHGSAGALADELATTPDAAIGRRAYMIVVHGRAAVFVTETLVAGRLRATAGP